MTDRAAILQQIADALRSVEELTGVFDEQAPADQPSPYAVLGAVQELPGRLLADTERKLFVTLHLWSEYQGKVELLRLADAVEQALPFNFCFDDFQLLKDEASGWEHLAMTLRVYFTKG